VKKIIINLLRHLTFWLLIFASGRIFFLIYYHGIIAHSHIKFTEIAGLFFHALQLDVATFCYIASLFLFLYVIESITKWRAINQIVKYLNFLLIGIYFLIVAGETGLYDEWHTKLNMKALAYLKHPAEVIASAQTLTLVIMILFWLVSVFTACWLYNKFIFQASTKQSSPKAWKAVITYIVLQPILIIGSRGGIQQIPINQSQSYFSKHAILNHAAVNPAFNLYISWFENRQFKDRNPFIYMDQAEARHIVDSLFAKPTTNGMDILTIYKPNIVMLILESWSADLIESLGGEPGITPEFRKLEMEGILFTQAYAGGKRSEQGLAAIFSGFPPHPYTSITVQPDKYQHLPSIVKKINAQGYHSSFYFGGQLIYGNIKSYIIFNQFDRIKEIYDFKLPNVKGKLGIHDEYTLNELLHDLAVEPAPFFSALFTLSSHSPYDQPMEEKLFWGDNERNYINSAYYTDWCLGKFFEQARHQIWYPNTLFILVADHSHNSYRNWHPNSFEYNRIPILFYGDVIREDLRGTQIDWLVSQTDLGTTLLEILKISTHEFYWGRNMFHSSFHEFTYLTFDYGVGWKVPEGEYIWDDHLKIPFKMTIPGEIHLKHEKNAKAFLQVLFDEYLNQ